MPLDYPFARALRFFVATAPLPLVTVEIQGVTFPFLALGPLVRLLGAGALPDGLPMPAMRSTAVGEDLGAGESG